jgi:hypothetical protein
MEALAFFIMLCRAAGYLQAVVGAASIPATQQVASV